MESISSATLQILLRCTTSTLLIDTFVRRHWRSANKTAAKAAGTACGMSSGLEEEQNTYTYLAPGCHCSQYWQRSCNDFVAIPTSVCRRKSVCEWSAVSSRYSDFFSSSPRIARRVLLTGNTRFAVVQSAGRAHKFYRRGHSGPLPLFHTSSSRKHSCRDAWRSSESRAGHIVVTDRYVLQAMRPRSSPVETSRVSVPTKFEPIGIDLRTRMARAS